MTSFVSIDRLLRRWLLYDVGREILREKNTKKRLNLCVFDGFARAEEFLVDESDAAVHGTASGQLGLLTPVDAVRYNHQGVVLTPNDTERIRYGVTCGRTANRVICDTAGLFCLGFLGQFLVLYNVKKTWWCMVESCWPCIHCTILIFG